MSSWYIGQHERERSKIYAYLMYSLSELLESIALRLDTLLR